LFWPLRRTRDLLDHLIRPRQHDLRDGETERPCDLAVDQELKLCRLLHRQITGFGTLQYLVDERRPGEPPERLIFESQAAFLQRRGLLLPGEQERLSAEALAVEIVHIPEILAAGADHDKAPTANIGRVRGSARLFSHDRRPS
jgi:hypothetical protein